MATFAELAAGNEDEAVAFDFLAAVTDGRWKTDDPDFVPNPPRAAELEAKAAESRANAEGWRAFQQAAGESRGDDEVENPDL